jgi:phosphoesterase RecJ-like protein
MIGDLMTQLQTDERGAARGPQATLADIGAEIAAASKVLVATHENPDGDAIGSARSMQLVCQALGVPDVKVYVPHGARPREYEFIRPEEILAVPPSDMAERLLVCVDCGNESRLANAELAESATRVINIDHHADNTNFGHLNYIQGSAACAAELVWELGKTMGVTATRDLATAVYVGLVTDTGRFQYSNTSSHSLKLAAELVDAGVDVHQIFQEVYESASFPTVKLLGRALEKAQQLENGVVTTYLTRQDFEDCGAKDADSEGIVDHLRGVDGAVVAVFVRDLEDGGKSARKGSLRTTNDTIDVSIIARTWSGGGHRQAAGFSTNDDLDAILARVQEHLQ